MVVPKVLLKTHNLLTRLVRMLFKLKSHNAAVILDVRLNVDSLTSTIIWQLIPVLSRLLWPIILVILLIVKMLELARSLIISARRKSLIFKARIRAYVSQLLSKLRTTILSASFAHAHSLPISPVILLQVRPMADVEVLIVADATN